jgi:hypothetical protein
MKLKHIIENIEKTKENSCDPNYEDLFSFFNIPYNWIDFDESRSLKCYFYQKWYCTDSWVGGRIYFLNDKPVLLSFQGGRKWDEDFSAISQEAYDETKKYLLSLLVEDEDDFKIESLDLDKEMGDGFHVSYGEQLLTKSGVYKPTGQSAEIIKTYRGMNDIKKWHLVDIKLDDGKIMKEVTLDEVLIPYSINK